MSFHLAFLPYYALIGVVAVATFIPPLNRLLDAVAVSFHFGTAQTGLGWTTESGAFHIPVFGHPGALLLYTSVLAVLLYRVAGRTVPDWRRLWRQVAVQGVPTTMTIITLVGVATVMAYSGMTFVLARGLTKKFIDDIATQRLIDNRRVLSRVMDQARQRGLCVRDDVADELDRVATPWSQR